VDLSISKYTKFNDSKISKFLILLRQHFQKDYLPILNNCVIRGGANSW
jgi:hypothetical protein